MTNTVVDALAEQAALHPAYRTLEGSPPQLSAHELEGVFPSLWLLPYCRMVGGAPVLQIEEDLPPQPATSPPVQEEPKACCPQSSVSPAVPIHALTANIQTMKDTTPSIFNPSGLAARRQYLYSQIRACKADIVCIQEARSRSGRWPGPGLLTWRSGAHKGQYGCEIWVRADITSPALRLSDWRILHSSPVFFVFPVQQLICPLQLSRHTPRMPTGPTRKPKAFWGELSALVRRTPSSRALIVGIDANGDFHAADDEGYLLGDLLSQADPGRNDDLLLEFCLVAGLEAPGTFSTLQQGQGWSWQHSSGRQKRLDHLLYRPGPWTHHTSSQAFDFDIVNTVRDHVALRVHSTLTCPQPRARVPGPRKATPQELADLSYQVWRHLPHGAPLGTHRHAMTDQLNQVYHTALAALPPRPPLSARQPYLHTDTLAAFHYLRDWRSQIRVLQQGVTLTILRAVWDTWKGQAVEVHSALYQQRLVLGAHCLHERSLQRKVHDGARKDKNSTFPSFDRLGGSHLAYHRATHASYCSPPLGFQAGRRQKSSVCRRRLQH